MGMNNPPMMFNNEMYPPNNYFYQQNVNVNTNSNEGNKILPLSNPMKEDSKGKLTS